MRHFIAVVALTALLTNQVQTESSPDYENPLRTSADDEIKSLPRLNEAISFRQYSGYLSADRSGKKFLHYWFVEATEDPASKPVLLWLNGGPGCSSMEGLFSELGPFELNEEATEVKLRKYSWNKLANVIFLESPAGVGYSYDKRYLNLETDDTTATGNLLALRSFFNKFPQYKNNPLYLTGESYAGVYLPTLGVLVDASKELNLRGMAIGNGYLDANKLDESLVFFAYYHGLIGKSDWDDISAKCCHGKPPARENCVMIDRNASYDCVLFLSSILKKIMAFPGLNIYNMYGDCPQSKSSDATTSDRQKVTRYSIDSALRKMISEQRVTNSTQKSFGFIKNLEMNNEPPCFDGDRMIKYLNDASVREAIHIPKKLGDWGVCADLHYVVKYPTQPGGLAPQMKQLINSKRNLTLLVFNGDTDMVCNAIGDEWFVDDLGRKVIADYTSWKVNKQIAGWVKHYDGITYATVRGSGHMVPEFRPEQAFEMIKTVLNSKHPNVLL